MWKIFDLKRTTQPLVRKKSLLSPKLVASKAVPDQDKSRPKVHRHWKAFILQCLKKLSISNTLDEHVNQFLSLIEGSFYFLTISPKFHKLCILKSINYSQKCKFEAPKVMDSWTVAQSVCALIRPCSRDLTSIQIYVSSFHIRYLF